MTDQCAYKWGKQILTPARYASEDDDPMDNITADKNDVPNDMDHTHPDEGDVQKSQDKKMSIRMSEKLNDAQTYMSVDRVIKKLKVATAELKTKVEGMEFSESTTQTRLVMLDIKSSPMITEPPEPNVTTDAAPSTEVTSGAFKDLTTLTPTAAEENPAVDKSEEAKEEDAAEPIVAPATGTPTQPVATETSPRFEPGGSKTALEDIVPTLMVLPEQIGSRLKRHLYRCKITKQHKSKKPSPKWALY